MKDYFVYLWLSALGVARTRNMAGLAALVLAMTTSVPAANMVGTITYTDPSGLTPVSSPPYVGGYVVHTFTASGTLTIPSSVKADVLVVGGGGGGGGLFGDGGGAGGLVYTNISLNGGSYSVTVGAGGAGSSANTHGANGGNSVIGTLTALGGGGGGCGYTGGGSSVAGANGGSGGGGGGYTSAPGGAATQPSSASGGFGNAGFAGGTSMYAGGGGAGTAATDSAGGDGLQFAISGVNTYYSGGGGGLDNGGGTGLGGLGGGGGTHHAGGPGDNGIANTGGGGGGGWNAPGGCGGSGIVIVRYPFVTNQPLAVLMTSPGIGQSFWMRVPISAAASVVGGTWPYSVTYHYKLTTAACYTDTAAVGDNGTGNFAQTLGATLPLGTYQIYATVADGSGSTAISVTNTFTVSLAIPIAVQDASFESPGVLSSSHGWAYISCVWNPGNGQWSEYQQNSLSLSPQDGNMHFTRTCPGGGDWYALINGNTVSISQDLKTTVNAGDSLSMTFYGGRGKAVNAFYGGVFNAAFLVGSTSYSMPVDTTVLANDSWQSFALNRTITNSGELVIQFTAVSGDPWLDNISVTRTILNSTQTAPANFTGIGVSGTTLTLAAKGGTPNGLWTLLQSTNVALPLSQWTSNSTGNCDDSGVLSIGPMNIVTNAQQFFKLLTDSVSAMKNFFAKTYTGTRTDFTGNAGYEFVPKTNLLTTALGRSVSGGRLLKNHQVTIWDTTAKMPLATVTVSAASQVDELGFAYELLDTPVPLVKDVRYRITSSEEAGGDPMMDAKNIAEYLGVVSVGTAVYAIGTLYPAQEYGGNEQGYGVPTFYFDEAGLDPALLKVPEPVPFVRDISTGYLLQYSFMSPKPYCWPGTNCLLSGWELDQSGGHFEYSPRPSGLPMFNIDWFKLVDTSTNGAITLRHQIAHQTEGKVTLEFRFNLPQKMDGACWQLCDLHQAGVSLVTSGTNLCWGTGQVLMPYHINQDYGLKVVADLTAKTADVYVDGEVKARGVSFVNPINSFDYFLVKTGDAATGELFLDPVNIYKGYTVNETFVTCGVGKVPADWQVAGGSVHEFDCGTRPDVYSLQMTGGAAQRTFGSMNTKTVLECRFLLPGPTNGLSINLAGVELAGFQTYRTNFWYLAKVIADPTTNLADIYINGKMAATAIACTNPVAAVRFTGNLWVDDVQVYPWRDYPADYVPAPAPCPAKSPYQLGVQSCNLWREGTSYAGWDYIYPYSDKRKPYLGWYDEGNPEETDWEIKWQVEHGITFEQHCWYRPDNAINHPIKDGVLDQGIIKGLFNARYGNLAKFTIMCTDQGACTTNPQDWTNNIIPYWIEYFFKDPRYFKINGKPVVSIYEVNNWQQMFGGVAGGAQAVAQLRAACQQAGFPGVIVLMELRMADTNVMQTMKAMGVDCCYAYTWGTPDVNAQRNDNVAQANAAASVGFNMLPSISMGWDRQAWGAHDGGWAAVSDYQALAQWTKDTFMPSLPAGSLGRQIVMLANWNEFGEGHFLMPSTLAGFGYLDALRSVFADGSTHQDSAPNAQQQKRFTILYPKD